MTKSRFVSLAAAAVLALVTAYTAPRVANACGPYCDPAGGGVTPSSTGIGSSCSIATTNLTTQLKAYANGFCGPTGSCQLVVHTTIACHAEGGGYSVTGYGTFGCRDSTC